MQHRVYLSISIGAPRNHHALFVESEPDGPGTVFQATGNIQNGMTFEVKLNNRPEASPEFLRKEYLGWVSAADLHRVEQVCAAVPPPKKQFEGPRHIYPGEPLRRCRSGRGRLLMHWSQRAFCTLRRRCRAGLMVLSYVKGQV